VERNSIDTCARDTMQSEFQVVYDDELDQQHQFPLLEDLKNSDLRILK